MKGSSLFKIATNVDAPFDGSVAPSTDPGKTASVSAFLTVQSLSNFAAMTGAIMAAWHALARLSKFFSPIWVPYVLALFFGVVSIAISWDALKSSTKPSFSKILATVFIALINSLVLASAVVGAGTATGVMP